MLWVEMDWNALALSLAWLLLAINLVWGIELMRGNRTLRALKNLPVLSGPADRESVSENLPRVVIVAAARNEAATIEAGLTSLLGQQYPYFQVVVVNDRSEDGTGEILDKIAREWPHANLSVCHLETLPQGWLGKNHALWQGTRMATELSELTASDFLLFTDADIVMAPTALQRVVRYTLTARRDHITILPEMTVNGLVLNTFMGAFFQFLSMYCHPWRASDPKSQYATGLGAFNLVRVGAYEAAGTYQAIKMRVDDDMRLGMLLKSAGFVQEVLLGNNMVQVAWYASLGEMINGLKKNAFSGMDFNPGMVVAGLAFYLLVYVWPFLALFVMTGVPQLLYGILVLWNICYSWDNARIHGIKPLPALLCGLTFPLSALLMSYILLLSMVTTLRDGGVLWRGTLYPIHELKGRSDPPGG